MTLVSRTRGRQMVEAVVVVRGLNQDHHHHQVLRRAYVPSFQAAAVIIIQTRLLCFITLRRQSDAVSDASEPQENIHLE